MPDQKHPQLPDPFVINLEVYGPSVFTRNEADGAWPNGTQVRKIYAEDGEDRGAYTANGALMAATPIGAVGTIIGSIAAEMPERGTPEWHQLDPHLRPSKYVYWIEWRTSPDVCVAAAELKVEKL